MKSARFLVGCSVWALLPLMANAAGTYYTGTSYQPAQSRYGQSASYTNNGAGNYVRQTGYTTNGYASTRYNTGYGNSGAILVQGAAQQQPNTQQKTSAKKSGAGKTGFSLSGDISHEYAMWKMEMKESKSMLHYDNIAWNVLDLNGKYVFNMGNTRGQLDAGFRYGMQWGESTMVDDDITKGGYFITQWIDSGNNVIGSQIGHALSVGTSDGGNMLGFNVGFGLPYAFQIGSLKITPSIGYRYLKYKLETKKNYGLSVDTAACFTVPGSDEVQCDPAVIVHYDNGTNQIIWRDSITGNVDIADGVEYIDTAGTYYYQQPGTSHSYEVVWSGPYLAMDMLYEINDKNSVDARIELGMPGYKATGDQPYRFDWQHPKSLEDNANVFGALHLGLGANWSTAISDGVSFVVGVTYDYYNVSGADAKTYLNGAYYTGIYNDLLDQWIGDGKTESDMLDPDTGDPTAISIKNIEKTCSGWTCDTKSEIDSFYRSLGVRVGINARF